jgi:DNA-binding SARP family transcriptional activator/tetratricopeptide (TPR) repeat protein
MGSSSGLSISLLGPFVAELDGRLLDGFRTAKVRALLAYLTVESRRPWTRIAMGDLLWPDLDQREAQGILRNAMSNLRQVIGDRERKEPCLLISGDTLQFNREAGAWLDTDCFLRLVSGAGPPVGEMDQLSQAERLERALALYRGDFLEGLVVASAPFEQWQIAKVELYRQTLLDTLRLLVSLNEGAGDLEHALQHASRWAELEPWDEPAVRHLMLLLLHQGRRNAALAQFEAWRRRLREELEVEPEPATERLYQQIRSGQVGPALGLAAALPFTGAEPLPDFLSEAATTQGRRPHFVARKKELRRLETALQEAVQGRGRLLLITGDPGSGKTALMAEFARQAMDRLPGLVVAWGGCNAYTGEADPFSPFVEITKTLSGDVRAPVSGGVMTFEQARRLWQIAPRVINALLDDGPDLINSFLAGYDMLAVARAHAGVGSEALARLQERVEGPRGPGPGGPGSRASGPRRPGPGRPGGRGPGTGRRPQEPALVGQVTRVLIRLSRRCPLLLILDDLQWIDGDSANLLFHLGRSLAGGRILLLGAYRPEEVALGRKGERHPLEGLVHELESSLGPLHIDLMQDDGLDFVQALLDSEPNGLSAEFRRMLHRHTQGQPLFTVELLRGMQLRGDLHRDRQGRWVEGPALDWERLPVRVEAVIAERIDHLTREDGELLRAACVEGESFTAEIVARLVARGEQEVIQRLSQEIGRRHRLVVAHSREKLGEQTLSQYRFRHFLYQKYLYQHLDPVERAQLHQEVAYALESIYARDLDKYPEMAHRLARHFELAGMVEKAFGYYSESGHYAIRLAANREAITHLERALHLLEGLAESPERDRQALELHLSLGGPLTATRGWGAPELEHHTRQAEELCHKMGDDGRLVASLWMLATYRLGRSEHARVDRLVRRLSSLARNLDRSRARRPGRFSSELTVPGTAGRSTAESEPRRRRPRPGAAALAGSRVRHGALHRGPGVSGQLPVAAGLSRTGRLAPGTGQRAGRTARCAHDQLLREGPALLAGSFQRGRQRRSLRRPEACWRLPGSTNSGVSSWPRRSSYIMSMCKEGTSRPTASRGWQRSWKLTWPQARR